ncbi:MAG TPA: hypothetical protein VHZ27_07850 [Solirubrobacteraceae bacterium]|jgi:hypothetical protein|nr:hypothetical protein [Solirubrobacteraceae bacterium]
MAESARLLLEGIARSLAEDVSPHVDDPFAQMQCKAAAELLGNLSEELDWSAEPLRRRNAELRGILDALRNAGWAARSEPDVSLPPGELREVLLDDLAAALRWLSTQPEPVQETIDSQLRADLDRQVASLRRGMFR